MALRFIPASVLSTYEAISNLNNNFSAIADLFDKCVFRDGSTPNSLEADVDANHYSIKNLAAPADPNDPVRLTDLQSSMPALSGSSLATLATSVGASMIGFIQSGVGAVLRTLQAKGRDTISVKDFGAVGDGTTDDTPAFNAAHTAAAALGAKVYVPGTAAGYKVAGTIIAKVSMHGDGISTVIKTSSATLDVIQVGSPAVTITDLQITSSVTRTAGYFINFNGVGANTNYASRVQRCYLLNWFNGIGFTSTGALNTLRVTDCWLTTNVPLGVGIDFSAGAPVVDAVVRDTFIHGLNAGTQPNYGVRMDYIGDITLDHVSTVFCAIGADVEPTGTHTAEAIFIDNCLFDSGGNSGIRIGGAPGTTVNLVQIHNTWSCTNINGLLLNGPNGGAAGTIQRVEVVGGYFCNNTTGQGIRADVVSYLDVSGGVFAGNVNGISIAANVSNFKIRGARCGTSGLFPINSGYGISVAAGTSTNFVLHGNDLSGNGTGALSNGATGAGGFVTDNIGVNPGGTSTVTVTASPFTYTAGYSNETVYINGGTVTAVTVGGQNLGIIQGGVRLGPKQAVVVTYTVAPTMVKTVS